MKIAAVILNYNDSDETADAVRRIAEYESIETVIVVDNASTDGSAERLRQWLREMNRKLLEEDQEEDEPEQFHRYMLVQAEQNGGYGSGNNLGVQYAYEIAGAELVLIANPDAAFSEDCVRKLAACFEEDDETAVAAAVLQRADGTPDYQASAWPLRSFWGELANSGPLLRRIFRKGLNYPDSWFQGKNRVPVDVVHGSLLMVDAGRFMACGGYDEEMFLYCEENVLAQKLREHDSKTFLVTDACYTHGGAGTISRQHDAAARQCLRQASERHYYRTWFGIGAFRQGLVRLFQGLVLLETRLFLK